jgi:hypothetical protein
MRRRVQGSVPDADDLQQQRRVVEAFLAAAREGDFERLITVLDPDIVLRADGGALAGASRFVREAQAVAGQAATFSKVSLSNQIVLVNGNVGGPGATSRRSTIRRDRFHDRQRKNRRDVHPRGPGSTQQARSSGTPASR